MIKSAIQTLANHFGYRIVARNRDPQSIYRYILKQDLDTIVDVGANTGQTCASWLKELPRAHVYAFEPMPAAVLSLRQHTNRWSERISIFEVAASDTHGKRPFQLHAEHTSSSSLQARTEDSARLLPFTERTETIYVRVDKLDTLLAEKISKGLGQTLIKLDVQGHELAVLRGAENLLLQTRFILTEVNLLPLYDQQPSFMEILDFMKERNFSLIGFAEQFHLADGKPVYFDALFERQN